MADPQQSVTVGGGIESSPYLLNYAQSLMGGPGGMGQSLAAASPWAMGAAAVPAIIGGIGGLVEAKQGRDLAAKTVRPTLDISKPYENMLHMFQQQAQYGVDANALNFANENYNNALTKSLNTMLMAGANPNDIAGAYNDYANSANNLAIADSERRWQKINAVADAQDKLSQAQTQEFLYNKDAPYKDAAQLAAAKQQEGHQQFMSSLDSLFGNLAQGLQTNYKANKQAPGDATEYATPALDAGNIVKTTPPAYTPGQVATSMVTGRNPSTYVQGMVPPWQMTATGGSLTLPQGPTGAVTAPSSVDWNYMWRPR